MRHVSPKAWAVAQFARTSLISTVA